MRLLILTAFYPVPGGTHERMFVHVRNQYYQQHGAEVTVLNFAAENNYEIDGIKVITLDSFRKSDEKYDIAVSHSANVRNHYRFLKKYSADFEHLVFFFHGHEMLNFAKDYPVPYKYTSDARFAKRSFQRLYDYFKIRLWTDYYRKLKEKSEYVFVSNWMFEHFQKNTGITESELKGKYHIINNSVGKIFEAGSYDTDCKKAFDFITIRSNLDGSKYCVDLVMKCALANPDLKFLIIGKGRFFENNQKPDNVTWIPSTLAHEEMLDYINKSRFALMLTRQDTQGVMACELATFGIPVITSDIEVCHEILDGFENVFFFRNEDETENLQSLCKDFENREPFQKQERFYADYTIGKEMELFKSILGN